MARTTINSQGVPVGTITASDLSYPLTDFSSTGIDDNASSNAITISSSQAVTMSGLTYPTTDGTANQVLTTDGSGALTFADTSSGGVEYVAKTTTYTASANEGIIANTSGGAWTLTLPASPSAGDKVFVADGDDWSTNNLTVARNGSTIEGSAADFTMDYGGVNVGFIYDGSTWQVYPQAGLLQLMGIDDNATSTALTISSSGDVGIGTSPTQRLDVREEKTGGGVLIQVYNTDNSDTTTQTAGLALGPDTRGATARITAVKENASFAANAGRDVALTFSSVLNNSPTEAMRIDSSGNVGIGLTDPEAQLHVDGTGGGRLRLSDLSASSDGDQIGGIAAAAGSGTFYSGINFFYHDSNDGEIRFRTKVNNTNTDVMTIVDGNVGIGTTNPTSNCKLHLADADVQIKLEGTGGSNSGFINFDGTNLQLSTNRNMKDGAFSNTGKSNASILLLGPSGGSTIRFYTANADNTTASERIRITHNGRFFANESPGTTMGGFGVESNAGLSVYPDAGFTVIQADTSNHALYVTKTATASGQYVNFATNGTTRGAITETGTNIGIQFGGTAAASHTLDDYEEGTWDSRPSKTTSSVTLHTGAVVSGYAGRYTKIGRLVVCQFYFEMTSATSTDTTDVYLVLPFAASGTNNWSGTAIETHKMNFPTGATYITVRPEANQSYASFKACGDSISRVNMRGADMFNLGNVYSLGTFSYFTDA